MGRNCVQVGRISVHDGTTYILTRELLASLATHSFAKLVIFLEIYGLTRELLASLATHSFGR